MHVTISYREPRFCWLVALAATLWGSSLHAEIVLDDFNDSAVVVSPASANAWTTTNPVGPFAASRRIRIGWGQGNPEGVLDANVTKASTLTGKVPHLNPRNAFSQPIVSLQFEYAFSGADFAQGGANDTLFMDFRRMESVIPPSYLLIILDGTIHSQLGLPRSADPFSIAIPFNSFSRRDGTPGLADYTRVTSISFEIRGSGYTGGGPDPLNFVMELDRLRIGQAVPEASTLLTLTLAGVLLSGTRRCGILTFGRGKGDK